MYELNTSIKCFLGFFFFFCSLKKRDSLTQNFLTFVTVTFLTLCSILPHDVPRLSVPFIFKLIIWLFTWSLMCKSALKFLLPH